jgi:hypothetical protein
MFQRLRRRRHVIVAGRRCVVITRKSAAKEETPSVTSATPLQIASTTTRHAVISTIDDTPDQA